MHSSFFHTSAIDRVPPEIWLHIFSLTLGSIIRQNREDYDSQKSASFLLMRVSKYWKELIVRQRSWWSRLGIKVTEPESSILALLKFSEPMSVDIFGGSASLENWKLFSANSRRVKSIDVDISDTQGLDIFFKGPILALKSVRIANSGPDVFSVPDFLLSVSATELRCLVLKEVTMSPDFTIIHSFPGRLNLAHLSIDLRARDLFGCEDAPQWLDLLQYLPNLEHLRLSLGICPSKTEDSEEYRRPAPVSLPNLKEFQISCDVADAGDFIGNIVLPASCLLQIHLFQKSECVCLDGLRRGLVHHFQGRSSLWDTPVQDPGEKSLTQAGGVGPVCRIEAKGDVREVVRITFHGPSVLGVPLHRTYFDLRYEVDHTHFVEELIEPPAEDLFSIMKEATAHLVHENMAVELDMHSPLSLDGESACMQLLNSFTNVTTLIARCEPGVQLVSDYTYLELICPQEWGNFELPPDQPLMFPRLEVLILCLGATENERTCSDREMAEEYVDYRDERGVPIQRIFSAIAQDDKAVYLLLSDEQEEEEDMQPVYILEERAEIHCAKC
ncbi:hypothetical protein D9613_005873 [Agrocybe pediades]|uniref:F-box domain-containing protein n=1 Tax=Agrocybe pediades TaxID=84607 RepID=A0A8H4QVJ7_9AGAR|nr:hypothetical protein D9613_005873 [Agrocybe pediades]